MSGKVVVIFGGTSGIGLEIVRLCQELGIISYGFSRSTGADIRNPQAIRTALENVCKLHNRIDVVICSAGIMVKGQLERMEIDDIVDQINTNLIGSMLVAKESITYLKMTSGSMLFFASSSYTRGRGDYIPYSASKAGLVNFVQGLAEEMSSYSIKVNVINPERTNTPLRRAHFLDEDKTTLLSPRFVALATLRTIASGITGAVIDVRKVQEDG
jgi:2-C-methyl-D-erythritol 4-phosphate cytidylyltransferase